MKRSAACHLESFWPWVKSQDAYGTFTEKYGERKSKEFEVCLKNGSTTKAAFAGEFIELVKEFGYCALQKRKLFPPNYETLIIHPLEFTQYSSI